HESIDEAPRHTSGAEHAHDLRILPTHVAHADCGIGANAHVLEHPIVNQGERLAVFDAGEEDQTAVGPGPDAESLVNACTAVLALVHDVRLHADREIAAG